MKFEDQVFENEDVRLDFNTFVRCRFVNSRLIFSAFGPVEFVDCGFENPHWLFKDAAGRMLEFLHVMYKTNNEGKQFVANVFDTVRGGDH